MPAFVVVGFVAAVAAATWFCGGGSNGSSCGWDSAFALSDNLSDEPVFVFWQVLLQHQALSDLFIQLYL